VGELLLVLVLVVEARIWFVDTVANVVSVGVAGAFADRYRIIDQRHLGHIDTSTLLLGFWNGKRKAVNSKAVSELLLATNSLRRVLVILFWAHDV
jgi:hypothetical protein